MILTVAPIIILVIQCWNGLENNELNFDKRGFNFSDFISRNNQHSLKNLLMKFWQRSTIRDHSMNATSNYTNESLFLILRRLTWQG